ncbi:MAG: hypothetical protein K9L88_18610 [Chromatiaceae bacterium]|nr:hypothetical protein [Chromatiaceae bacterium]
MSEQFTAELTREQVDHAEEITQTNGWIRRTGMMMLTQSQSQIAAMLRSGDEEVAHGILDLAEALKTYTERAQSEIDLLKAAEARLWLVIMDEADRRDAMEANA